MAIRIVKRLSKFSYTYMYNNMEVKIDVLLYRFGIDADDDEEANLFGMYGTPEDKAKIASH